MENAPDMSSQSTPAARVIAAFGGVQRVAAAIGRHSSRVHRWTYPVERGGTGGRIPGSAVPKILKAAAERGIALTPNDLFEVLAIPSRGSKIARNARKPEAT